MKMFKLCEIFRRAVLLSLFCCFAARAGEFVLTDAKTMMPVLKCAVPAGGCMRGNVKWLPNPEQATTWTLSCAFADGTCAGVAGGFLSMVQGPISRAPVLNNPNILAQKLLPAVREYTPWIRDWQLQNAKFTPDNSPQAQQIVAPRVQLAQRGGQLRVSRALLLNWEGVYAGRHPQGGAVWHTKVVMPMVVMEIPMAGSFVSTQIEFICNGTVVAPPAQCEALQRQMNALSNSIRPNRKFQQLMQQIAARRTADFIQLQNEIHEIQMGVATRSRQAGDYAADQWDQYLRGVDVVTDPRTGEKLAVDYNFDHTRRAADGTVIQWNDDFKTPYSRGGFDPATDPLFNSKDWGPELRKR